MHLSADTITPFIIDKADVRGRFVRLSHIADTILARYDYPPAVAAMLGELLLVAAMLGANLKQEGIFTVQIRGHGLVPLMVADAVFGGQLRGFAETPDAARAAIAALGDAPTPRQLFGEDAYFAITLDPGADMQRYQGVVALEGVSVTDALMHYFTHSQQVDIWFALGVARHNGHWQAGGLMLERLPSEHADYTDPHAPNREAWRTARALAGTVTQAELVDPLMDAQTLLYRLYHEEGVWVHDAHTLTTGCRCSRARIQQLLLSMPTIDRADMIVDGAASVHCQFCNTTEKFTPADLALAVQ